MRPALLDPLFAQATMLDGVGAKIAGLIGNVANADLTGRDLRVGDLLFVLPYSAIDRRSRPGVAFAAEGQTVTLDLTVARHQPPPRGRGSVPYRVFAFDETDPSVLHIFARHLKQPKHAIFVWFQGQHVWVEAHERYEGEAGQLGLMWFWVDYEQAVVQVISCFDVRS